MERDFSGGVVAAGEKLRHPRPGHVEQPADLEARQRMRGSPVVELSDAAREPRANMALRCGALVDDALNPERDRPEGRLAPLHAVVQERRLECLRAVLEERIGPSLAAAA